MQRNKMTALLFALLIIASLSAAVIAAVILPSYLWRDTVEIPENGIYKSQVMIFVSVSAVPFYYAIVKAWLIISEIGKNNSFSEINAKRLNKISLSAAVFSAWYLIGAVLSIFIPILDLGCYVILFLVIFLSAAFSAITAVLSHLTAKAAEIKNENDMTV